MSFGTAGNGARKNSCSGKASFRSLGRIPGKRDQRESPLKIFRKAAHYRRRNQSRRRGAGSGRSMNGADHEEIDHYTTGMTGIHSLASNAFVECICGYKCEKLAIDVAAASPVFACWGAGRQWRPLRSRRKSADRGGSREVPQSPGTDHCVVWLRVRKPNAERTLKDHFFSVSCWYIFINSATHWLSVISIFIPSLIQFLYALSARKLLKKV